MGVDSTPIDSTATSSGSMGFDELIDELRVEIAAKCDALSRRMLSGCSNGLRSLLPERIGETVQIPLLGRVKNIFPLGKEKKIVNVDKRFETAILKILLIRFKGEFESAMETLFQKNQSKKNSLRFDRNLDEAEKYYKKEIYHMCLAFIKEFRAPSHFTDEDRKDLALIKEYLETKIEVTNVLHQKSPPNSTASLCINKGIDDGISKGDSDDEGSFDYVTL